MYPSQQHNFPPPRAPLPPAGQHPPPAHPPLHVSTPPYHPYNIAYSMSAENYHPTAPTNPAPMASNTFPSMANGNGVPPSPSQHSSTTDDMSLYDAPDLPPISYIWRNHGYALQIIQQPQRARMCGFGDKVRADSISSVPKANILSGSSSNNASTDSQTPDHRSSHRRGDRIRVRLLANEKPNNC